MKYTFYICFDKWKIIVYLGGSNEYYKNKSKFNRRRFIKYL